LTFSETTLFACQDNELFSFSPEAPLSQYMRNIFAYVIVCSFGNEWRGQDDAAGHCVTVKMRMVAVAEARVFEWLGCMTAEDSWKRTLGLKSVLMAGFDSAAVQ
jgi:hypothetical protein